MGSFLSYIWYGNPVPERPPKNYLLPCLSEEDFPEEGSRALEDLQGWYDQFLERIFCFPHKDGKSILIVDLPDDFPDSRERPGWPIKRMRGAYELLGDGHPRIVRCVCILIYLSLANLGSYLGPLQKADGIIVKRLEPGPWNTVPVMTIPLPKEMSREDKIMLSLYYRWALQALSAFKFAHSRSVFFRNFCSQLVWLRSDFSLAITGFFCASAPEIEEEEKKEGDIETRMRKIEPCWPHGDPPFMLGLGPEPGEDYLSSPWSEGELITYGGMGGDRWKGDNVYGSVKEDLSV
jgi:hypothetical protein